MSNKRQLKKIKWNELVRLTSLLAVVGFFILVPLSNWYANNKIAYNQQRLVGLADGEFMAFIYSCLDNLYSLWSDPIKAATSNNGSLWAYTVLGIPISDPLGLIAELINSVKFPTKYLIGGLIPFLIALIFGRVFCAWFCPMVLLFGINARIRKALDKVGVPLLRIKLPSYTRTFLFWFGLIISHFMGAWVWHFILPYITFSHEIFSIIIFSSVTIGFYFLLSIVLLDLAVIPGEFCKSVCPTGLLLGWVGRFRLFKIHAESTKCPKYCIQCLNVCPVGLYPRKDIKLNSCHLCLKCKNQCPKQIISLRPTFNLSKVAKLSKKAIPLIQNFLIFSVLTISGSAKAHHYKGLPHYSYFENYPQVPILEFIAEGHDYEMLATVYNFQGLNMEQVDSPDDVRLYVYIFDIQRNKSYLGKVNFEISSDNEKILQINKLEPEQESIYLLQKKIKEQSNLLLTASFLNDEGKQIIIKLPIQITPSFLEAYGVYFAIVGFFIVVMAIKLLARNKSTKESDKRLAYAK
ncbi:MAG: 4Fe-4S binding protein [Bdellovibrionota bacterium]